MIGKTLGRYEILSELGAGGMATVYRARDQELGRDVAVKMMHPHLAKRPEYAERFRREARAVAALHHPNIIEIHDFVRTEDDGQRLTFMVSELVEGPSLSGFLAEHGQILPEVAALVAAKLAEALETAHAAGIVHRDVKPENVLIAPGGRVVLTDFGIARVLEGETVTATGALIGSPSYMSPEQAKGTKPRPASDCFSLGVVLYRMATGRLPFPGKDPLTVISAILKGRYVPPVQAAPAVGNRLDRIIVACLEPDADDRTSSAVELADELYDFAAEGGLTAADEELARFFAAPKEYEANATRRIVTSLLDRAERRAAEGALAGSLALCDRVLSLDPDNTDASRILENVGRRRSGRTALLVGLGVLVIAAVVALGWVLWPKGSTAGSSAGRASGGPELVGQAQVDAGVGFDGGAIDASAAQNPPRVTDAAAPAMRPYKRVGPRRPRRRIVASRGRDAGVRIVARRPDAAVAGRPPPMPTGPGRLQVIVLPFCDLKVDGKPFGRSPMPKAKAIAAGSHTVVCRHPVSGRTYKTSVQVRPGKLTRIRHSLLAQTRVIVRLTRGTRIVVGSATYRSGTTSMVPGSQRYRLVKGQTLLEQGWVSIPPGRCTLVDSPRVRCR